MGCASCGLGVDSNGKVRGCNNNGGCETGGCNRLNVFDWLSDMSYTDQDTFQIVEVRFKGGRKEFYKNTEGLELHTGDLVVLDVPNGHHVGTVSMQGELVRLQMRKKRVEDNDQIKKIYRKATLKDVEKFNKAREREIPTLLRTREIIKDLKLDMKLSDVEFQADGSKATFFYSADERVDFRELIKVLASEFRIRVEMKQISLRQEAGRLGGLGSCGRELCCSTWLTDFKSVSTSAARYQNLSLNPSKLSGQCGRLKCCLNYELDTYQDALKDIPEVKSPLLTEKGKATLMKTDIFRKLMWFGFEKENSWYPVPASRVKEILEMNKNKIKPSTLLEDDESEKLAATKAISNELELLDKKFRKKDNKRKKRRKNQRRGRSNRSK